MTHFVSCIIIKMLISLKHESQHMRKNCSSLLISLKSDSQLRAQMLITFQVLLPSCNQINC